jgi:hypothetical protein
MLEKNHILFYSSVESGPMNYVSIGSCDYDPQDPEPYILPEDQSEEGWKNFFNANGSNVYPIQALNYMLLMNIPEECLPERLLKNFENNKSQIESIVHNWFEPDSSLIKHLPLELFFDEVYEEFELSDDLTKYVFKNGTVVVINENQTDKYQCFIPVEKLRDLNDDIRKLAVLLNG